MGYCQNNQMREESLTYERSFYSQPNDVCMYADDVRHALLCCKKKNKWAGPR